MAFPTAIPDRSLQEIAKEEPRWDFATTTQRLTSRDQEAQGSAPSQFVDDSSMTPIQALEMVRGFGRAIQESTPEPQREVVQRVLQRIVITDDRVTDVDVYPVHAEALRWYWRPQPDKFRTSAEYKRRGLACWRTASGRSTDGPRTISGRLAAVRRALTLLAGNALSLRRMADWLPPMSALIRTKGIAAIVG
jgi:hypothetical protein